MTAATQIVDVIIKAKRSTIHSGNLTANEMRMLSADEALAAMSFPDDTKRPPSHRLTMHLAGNAVAPLAAKRIIEALKEAA